MRYLKQNTATRVTVGPFMDKADGITPETALTVTNCKLTLMVDDGGVPTLVLDAAATASAGNNDMVHVTNDDAGFYDLELTAAQLNYVGRAMLAITDAANHCPVFHEFTILPANVYDSLMGTDKLDVNAAECGGTTLTGRDIGASVLLSSGTGTGQVSLSSGTVTVGTNNDKTGYALTAAYDAAKTAATQTSVDTIDGIVYSILADTGTDGVVVAAGSKAGYSLTATTGLGNQTANITGNLSGSVGSVTGAVGSVTGAVGSVTGNVGGNVAGSVGSVTGAVGSVTGNVGGNVVGSVGSVATGGITAASIADAAIDFATFAADCKTGTGLKANVESVSANAITATAIATGAITSAKFAAGAIDAAAVATGAIDADALASDAGTELADAIWDEQVDGTVTARQSIRGLNSASMAKLSGAATTTVAIRDLADSKNRITATVDADGNRTAVTRDLT